MTTEDDGGQATATAADEYYGYLTLLKTLATRGLKAVFDAEYPTADLRGVNVSVEYPIAKVDYPAIWVDYTDTQDLVIAGVDHQEMHLNEDGSGQPYTRWKYAGYVTFTATALTSRERDAIYDDLVRVLAFGKFNPVLGRFRTTIETNPFIAANVNFDKISPQGQAAAPGTPWGTDEIIYERTINMEIIGEFISDNTAGVLFPLTGFDIIQTPELPSDDGTFPPVEPVGDDGWH